MKRLIFSFLLIGFISGLFAQSVFESAGRLTEDKNEAVFQLGGYVRGSAYGGAEKYDFSTMFGEADLQLNYKTKALLMNADLRFRSGYQFGRSFSELELTEAYAGISTKMIDLLLGEQIVSWGRTDGFNPTNNICPNHYFFLTANPDDQKRPNFMLRTRFRFSSEIDWEIIAIPVYRASVYRYDLFNLGASFADPVLPAQTIGNGSLATRFNVELPGIGFSLSWFNGYDPFYGFDLNKVDFSSGSPDITYLPSYYRKNTFGLDFALPLASWIIRGEGAYNLTDNEDAKMYIPNSDLSYVLGIERTIAGVTAILQYVGKHTLDFTGLVEPVLFNTMDPVAMGQYANDMILYESALINRKIFKQQFETNHAASFTLSGDFAYGTLNAEMTVFYDFSTQEMLLRPKLAWKISDALTITGGYSYMHGPDKSMFSYTASVMNGAFLELKVSY